MKKLVKIFYIVCTLIILVYLSFPNAQFPNQLPDSIQSYEPADIETPLRRGYYTNLTRDEVMQYYLKQVDELPVINEVPTYTLNYPPEESQILIRDQTRSTFLEEIVHPFRESFFINGFEPKLDKDMINIDGTSWRQKIIVRYYPSNVLARIGIGLITILTIPLIMKEWVVLMTVFKHQRAK